MRSGFIPDIHASGNPHIQTDPHNIARVAKVLAQRLAFSIASRAGGKTDKGWI
jgi:zinc/manganese transport system substrate-binding protein